MNFRGLALALTAAFAFAYTANAEIVVLVNGNRMDVKGYEIQSNVVIVHTWDGKVQSFPITWVDVEATKSVSHQYDPLAGLSPERVQKARMLLEGFGVQGSVAALFGHLEVDIRSFHVGTTRPTYDVVRGAFRNAYDGERIFDVVVGDFAREADDALLEKWSRWMSLPETQYILSMKAAAEPGDDDQIDQSRYLAELYSNPEMTYRQELVARLDNAVLASEAALEVSATLAESIQDARMLVLTSPPPYQTTEQIRERLWPEIRKTTQDELLYTYREATNDELLAYVSFWESEDGQRIADLVVQALASGTQYGAEMAVHSVAEGTGGTLTK